MTGPNYRITIGEKIGAYRKEKGLSKSAFARLIGVSAQAVWKWERGVCCPDIVFLPHLARILGCQIDDFFVKNGGLDEKG